MLALGFTGATASLVSAHLVDADINEPIFDVIRDFLGETLQELFQATEYDEKMKNAILAVNSRFPLMSSIYDTPVDFALAGLVRAVHFSVDSPDDLRHFKQKLSLYKEM